MAKKTVTKAVLPIVDLVRNKPKLKYIEIPKYRADVVIEVTTVAKLRKPKEAPKSAMDRLKAEADKVMLNYEKVIREEAIKLDGKIDKLMQQPSKSGEAEAKKMIEATNVMIKNALRSAEPAAQKAVEARLKKEAQGDKLLTEARVRTGIKVTVSSIKIGASVAKLVGTSGADVTSYKTILQEVVSLGLELKQQLKNEAALRKDLDKAVVVFLKSRESSIQQAISRQGLTDLSGLNFSKPKEAIKAALGKIKAAGDEITKGKDIRTIGQDVMKFAISKIKGKLNDIETARKKYREHTTKTRQRADKLGASGDKLMKAAKKATGLKDGVKLGAQCMNLRRQATAMNAKLMEREKYLEDIQSLMQANGLEIDDQTTIQKLKALDKATIGTESKALFDAIKEVKGLVENIAEAAA
ncbi:MAG: hypothetical protein AAGA08_08295 [Pseudomonadota bacterium]